MSIGHWILAVLILVIMNLSLIKLYLVNFLYLFLFFISFNSEERLFHILIPCEIWYFYKYPIKKMSSNGQIATSVS